jgi:hypothetical protein
MSECVKVRPSPAMVWGGGVGIAGVKAERRCERKHRCSTSRICQVWVLGLLRLTPTIAPIFEDLFHPLSTYLKIYLLFVYHCL